ncbi:MAG: IS4 family transposase [Sphingobacteriales bacterium]|nr:MAG: IS4 family transposase [Sphingobacteriales bacterium]
MWSKVQTRYLREIKDKRLLKRGNSILNRLFANSVHSIRRLAVNDSEAKSFYRFLQNDKVKEADLIKNMSANCRSGVGGKTVLCIQDSSEINLYRHRNRIHKDDHLGITNASETGLGFFIHPSFVLDAETLIPYGFADVKVWNRGHVAAVKDKSHAKNMTPLSQKESYKWIEASVNSKETLSEAASIIIIQDREADIYEQFCIIPDKRTHLLIRAKANRILPDKTRLFEHLSTLPKAGGYQIMLEGDSRRGIKKRTATIEVRFSKVTITSSQYNDKSLPATKELYAIEAREVTQGVENPILWRLLTTLPVEDFDTALLCIEWYSCRWMIEEVFRILKKEGFNIEASELEYGKGVRKLCLLMLETIVKLFLMQIAYAMPEEEGIIAPQSCFSEQEIECMELQMRQLEGRTEKLKNPYKPSDLKRYIWVIARLGGWKGYSSERKPGVTTFWYGLQKLTAIMQGWLLSRNVSKR